MSEKPLITKVILKFSEFGYRLFRINTGLAWQGDVQKLDDGNILIRNPRPFRAGIKGMPDTIGFITLTVTPEMVGRKFAIFTALEMKHGKTKTTPEQINFLSMVEEKGGISAIVRDEQDALDALDFIKKAAS